MESPKSLWRAIKIGPAENPSSIPDNLLKKLRQAGVDADMEEVEGIIEEIRSIDVETAKGLSLLADEFEYGKMAEIITETTGFLQI